MAVACPSCGYENPEEALFCGMCKEVFRKAPASEPRPEHPHAAGRGDDVAPGAPDSQPAASPADAPPEVPVPAGAAPPPSRRLTRLDHWALAARLVGDWSGDEPGRDGVLLDYSPASLWAIDDHLDRRHGTTGEAPDADEYHPPEATWALIVRLGSYVGEVVRASLGGAWKDDEQQPDNPLWTQLVLGGTGSYPIARVFRRFKNGADSALLPFLWGIRDHHCPDGFPGEAESFVRQGQHVLEHSARPDHERRGTAIALFEVATRSDPTLSVALANKIDRLRGVEGAGAPAPDAPALELDPGAGPLPDLAGTEPPLQAIDFAAVAAAIASAVDASGLGVRLDGQAASLAALDLHLDAAWGPDGASQDGPPPAREDEIFELGCYLGEVVRHTLGGAWVHGETDRRQCRLRLTGGDDLDPFAIVEERSAGGPGRSIWARFLELATGRDLVHPGWADGFCHQGDGLLAAGDPRAARRFYNRALEIAPELPAAWTGKGRCALSTSSWDKALDAFDRALTAGTDPIAAWSGRARALAELGRTDEALGAAVRTLALAPDDAVAARIRVQSLEGLGRPEAGDARAELDAEVARLRRSAAEATSPADALVPLERARDLDPADVDTARELAATLAQADRTGAALAILADLRGRDPDDVATLETEATVLAQLGRAEEALLLLERTLALEPGLRNAARSRVILLYQLGRLEEAQGAAGEGVQRHPDDGELWLFKGECEQRLGRRGDAIASLDRALTLGLDKGQKAQARSLRQLAAFPDTDE